MDYPGPDGGRYFSAPDPEKGLHTHLGTEVALRLASDLGRTLGEERGDESE